MKHSQKVFHDNNFIKKYLKHPIAGVVLAGCLSLSINTQTLAFGDTMNQPVLTQSNTTSETNETELQKPSSTEPIIVIADFPSVISELEGTSTSIQRADRMRDISEIDIIKEISSKDPSLLTIEEMESYIQELESIMKNAKNISDSAIAIGMDESSETILNATHIYTAAEEELNILTNSVENRKEEIFRAVSQYSVFDKTYLTANDYEKLLEGTPLAGHGQDFYDMEHLWGVNGLFALAVARTESGLGTSSMARNQNNYFGMIGMYFSSPREGILYFGELMNESIYYGKSISSIAKSYCPPTWSHWASQNQSFISEFWNKLN